MGAGEPNELWQMDVVGGFLLADGSHAKALTGVDDHSRFCVSAKLMARERTQPVCDGLTLGLHRPLVGLFSPSLWVSPIALVRYLARYPMARSACSGMTPCRSSCVPNRITCAGFASGSWSSRSSASAQVGSTSPVSGST